METIRIGSGPVAPVPPQPQKPRRRVLTGLATMAALLVLGVAIYGVAAILARNPAPPLKADPQPTLATFDEHATCVLLVPVLNVVTSQAMEMVNHPDGSTVDRAKVTKAIKDLETILLVAPSNMQTDIGEQLDFMRKFQRLVESTGGGSIDQHPAAQAGIRLGQICSLYANPN